MSGTKRILDGGKIRARRLHLNMSERVLAAAIGVSAATVNNLELETNHAELPLGVIDRLTQSLGVNLDELRPDDQRHADPDDVKVLGALLGHDYRLMPLPLIAEVLRWDLARAQAAVHGLEQLLPAVGLRLHRLHNTIQVVPAVTEPETVKTLHRRAMARLGLNSSHVRAVWQVVQGSLPRHLGNAQTVAVATLFNADVLTPPGPRRGGSISLSDEARYSLLLDDPLVSARKGQRNRQRNDDRTRA